MLRVEIPKPGGKGMRQLGIPTGVDRLIQQAVHQVLSPIYEKEFSEHSYGFRPGRSAWQAVQGARRRVAEGRRWVVDMDLEKFHDILMARVARKVEDKRVLLLQSGVMVGGLVEARAEGTPQGGPLSPLLSNILLDELDKELERRGHAFCRYADDCNAYVQAKRAGERVMDSVSRFLERRLKLKVNFAKSAVDRPWNRKFLGYSMTEAESGRRIGRAHEGKAPDALSQGPGSEPETLHSGGVESAPAGMDELLSPRRGEGHLRGAGRPAMHRVATRQASLAAREAADAAQAVSGARLAERDQRARPVVELRRVAHERSVSQSAL